ncbi:MAG: methyl-accepting chemotaxis protein [Lachnospiraceae bacterium]|nr:methyl-accepting chemotaxis protein [Lachnospiraceae bacterium]
MGNKKRNYFQNISLSKGLTIGFLITGLLFFAALALGYRACAEITTVSNPEKWLWSYQIFVVVMLVINSVVTTGLRQIVTGMLKSASEEVTRVANQVAEGNVDIEVADIGKNEFGDILSNLQAIIDNIKLQAGVITELSQGDYTMNVTPKNDNDMLGNSLKRLVEGNRNTLTDIRDAAYQVTTSSSQVASASEALAQGSTEQASAIEEITASITEIAEKTAKNAVEANTAAELVGTAIADVRRGNAEMQEMMKAMDDINKASESISKIIKVIDDIAFQTNILALNAAVEAARAGDAGKGFAVVAEEVRNLAAKSAAAAQETAELIENSIAKVGVGSKIADGTFKALEQITNAVSESESIITGIAEASNYQATAVAQITQAIGQVSQVVQTNSATSEQCAAASEELSNQAAMMRELISVYKLGNDVPLKAKKARKERVIMAGNANEQIISLGEGFGKY